MGLARIALLSCLLLSISYNIVDAEILCEVLTQETENFTCCAVVNDIICHVNQGNISYGSEYYDRTMICYNSTTELDLICEDTEMMLLEDTNTAYDCNCAGLICPLRSNITCTPVPDAEILCKVLDPNPTCCAAVTNNISCEINQTVSITYQPENSNTVCNSSTNGLDIICSNTEKALLANTNTTYECNCMGLICPSISNITCTPRPANLTLTTTIQPTTMHTSDLRTTEVPLSTTVPPATTITSPGPATATMTSSGPATATMTSSGPATAAMTAPRPATTTMTSPGPYPLPTTTTFNTNPPAIEMPTSTATAGESLDLTTLVLWIVLGCLIVLIIITIGAIFLVSVAYCRRYKKKKQPTTLDIISKWEDTPNESSEIRLLSVKTTEDGDDKADGEEQNNGGAEDKEKAKDDSDGKSETKEVNKDDDITVGTFGFAEKKAESTASKDENSTGTMTESERENQGTNGEKNEKLVTVTIENAGEQSTTGMDAGENTEPENKNATVVVSTEKEKAEDVTKPEPVPVQIPIIGKQVADEKAPNTEHTPEVKTSDSENTDKPSSPVKDQGVASETSPSSQDVSATESVSKEPEPAATITKPQTETVSLASDKPPSIAPSAGDATGGLSLFTNEDMEKALGVAATKDLSQVESTQL